MAEEYEAVVLVEVKEDSRNPGNDNAYNSDDQGYDYNGDSEESGDEDTDCVNENEDQWENRATDGVNRSKA